VDRLSRYHGSIVDPALHGALADAIAERVRLGAEVVEVELPFYSEMNAAIRVILQSEAMAYHLPDLRDRWSDYGPSTRMMMASATFYSGADYVQAQRVRRVAQKAVARLFADVDIVLTPTVSTGACSFAEL